MIVRQIGPKPVAWGVFAWSIVIGACMFVIWTAPHAGISHSNANTAYWIAGVLTLLVGVWLGWRRRTGTSFVAPILAWIVMVPFAFASEFARVGFFLGLWRGLWLAILGGFAASFVVGVLLVASALLGRIAAGVLGHDRQDPGVVIFPPGSG